MADERVGNLRDRQHEIHLARQDRAARHAVIAGFLRVLCNHEAATFLDGLQPKAAVGARARKNYADGARTELIGHRVQQEIERQPRAVARLGLREV